jgi:hypothetical protein
MNGWMWNMERWCVHTNVQSSLIIIKGKLDSSKTVRIQLFATAIAKLIIIKTKYSMKGSLKEDCNFKTLQNTRDNWECLGTVSG